MKGFKVINENLIKKEEVPDFPKPKRGKAATKRIHLPTNLQYVPKEH